MNRTEILVKLFNNNEQIIEVKLNRSVQLDMVIREHYLKKIRPFYDSNLVKVLIGVRYSGKSTLLEQIKDEIAKTTDNIISLSFKHPNDFLIVHTRKQLYSYVKEHRMIKNSF